MKTLIRRVRDTRHTRTITAALAGRSLDQLFDDLDHHSQQKDRRERPQP
ncbi:MAG TPA: hypothetical protein VFX60_19215 [Micromonospora sp.]|nr:hypothetical protein [Micromonospora sp.]